MLHLQTEHVVKVERGERIEAKKAKLVFDEDDLGEDETVTFDDFIDVVEVVDHHQGSINHVGTRVLLDLVESEVGMTFRESRLAGILAQHGHRADAEVGLAFEVVGEGQGLIQVADDGDGLAPPIEAV